MRAMSAFSRDAGMSTRVRLALTALRSRVSMSAIGSVIALLTFVALGNRSREIDAVHRHPARGSPAPVAPAPRRLPAALGHAGDIAFERQLAETQAAQREFSHVGSWTAAQAAPVTQPNLELRRLGFFRDL